WAGQAAKSRRWSFALLAAAGLAAFAVAAVLGVKRTLGPWGLPQLAFPFVLPYALSGALGPLAEGLFVDPQLRLNVTAHAPPPPSWAALPVLLALSLWRWPRVSAPVLGAILAVPALLLVANGRGASVYPAVVGAIRILLPCAVVAGSFGLLRARAAAPEE